MARAEFTFRRSYWLLRVRDPCGGETLPPTQELLAQSIDVQRNAISIVAHALQQPGIISYRRGSIDITNADGLRETACDAMVLSKRTIEGCWNFRIEAAHRTTANLVSGNDGLRDGACAGICAYMPFFLANDACKPHPLRRILHKRRRYRRPVVFP